VNIFNTKVNSQRKVPGETTGIIQANNKWTRPPYRVSSFSHLFVVKKPRLVNKPSEYLFAILRNLHILKAPQITVASLHTQETLDPEK
jgi:hypothetical protein